MPQAQGERNEYFLSCCLKQTNVLFQWHVQGKKEQLGEIETRVCCPTFNSYQRYKTLMPHGGLE
jgi:hypothetical protein